MEFGSSIDITKPIDHDAIVSEKIWYTCIIVAIVIVLWFMYTLTNFETSSPHIMKPSLSTSTPITDMFNSRAHIVSESNGKRN